MISIGKFRYLVTIQKLDGTLDAAGQEVQSWVSHGQRYASIEPLSGRELYTARQFFADVTTQMTMRYLAGVTPKMRVSYNSTVWNIRSAINIENANRELQILATEIV
ncbi:MAG TPA: phage head closure protein [Hyphomicrobiaceae bacterium]|nr:phage head closure protein [Hyphomicrobiaceae bacterium]